MRDPEGVVPGKPLFFASTMTLGGYGEGVLVQSRMGRPIKIEGNPDHPASLGATDVFAQASVLSLYDTDRSQAPIRAGQRGGQMATWDDFIADIVPRTQALRERQGAGLFLLTESITSPSLLHQIDMLLKRYPQARWYQYEPVTRHNASAGAHLAFGKPLDAVYRLGEAKVILSLGAYFLHDAPGRLRYARDFMDARRPREGGAGASVAMNRLYVIESTPSLAGAVADHRFALAPDGIEGLARALAKELGVDVPQASSPVPPAWLGALVRDLQRHGPESLVLAGNAESPAVHALAHAINARLGGLGRTVNYIEPVAQPYDPVASLRELTDALAAGEVDTLIILDGNPAYTAPADIDFQRHLREARFSVHLSQHRDETSVLAHWHLPQTHYLEEWGDARAFDGTVSLVQPLIAPLYGGVSEHELLAVLLGTWPRPGTTSCAASGRIGSRARARLFPIRISRIGGSGRWSGEWCRTRRHPCSRSLCGPIWRRLSRRPPLRRGASRLCSGPIAPYGTGASRTMPGCRRCPDPSTSSLGTTWPCSARRMRDAWGLRPGTWRTCASRAAR